MTTTNTTTLPTSSAPDPWELSRRIEAWAGEIRVNVIRTIVIAAFYGRHLIEVLSSPPDAPVRGMFHVRITATILAWVGVAATVQIMLARRRYPPMMKFVTSILDVLMITLLCAIGGEPRSLLIMLYFAAIAAAPLRLSLPLVYVTTASAILGYLALLANYAWYQVGFEKYYANPELRIPRTQEIVTVLTLLVVGVLAGQVVRQARRMIDRYPLLLAAGREPSA